MPDEDDAHKEPARLVFRLILPRAGVLAGVTLCCSVVDRYPPDDIPGEKILISVTFPAEKPESLRAAEFFTIL